ncbi:hypothetical protein ACFYPT_37560 [Streptomyces sp. NPDC005529]|uniref:hypothetical protein n=1 Tax=unclassified Streptomyces TaxID=2593676 RepID=UPI00339E8F2E
MTETFNEDEVQDISERTSQIASIGEVKALQTHVERLIKTLRKRARDEGEEALSHIEGPVGYSLYYETLCDAEDAYIQEITEKGNEFIKASKNTIEIITKIQEGLDKAAYNFTHGGIKQTDDLTNQKRLADIAHLYALALTKAQQSLREAHDSLLLTTHAESAKFKKIAAEKHSVPIEIIDKSIMVAGIAVTGGIVVGVVGVAAGVVVCTAGAVAAVMVTSAAVHQTANAIRSLADYVLPGHRQ